MGGACNLVASTAPGPREPARAAPRAAALLRSSSMGGGGGGLRGGRMRKYRRVGYTRRLRCSGARGARQQQHIEPERHRQRHQIESPKRATKESEQGRLAASSGVLEVQIFVRLSGYFRQPGYPKYIAAGRCEVAVASPSYTLGASNVPQRQSGP
jgi:hypothetical protein